MKYCYLHEDLSQEEGDGCPLCQCMLEHEESLKKWAETYKATKAELAAMTIERDKWMEEVGMVLRPLVRGISRLLLSFSTCSSLSEMEKLLRDVYLLYSRPEVRKILEEKL